MSNTQGSTHRLSSRKPLITAGLKGQTEEPEAGMEMATHCQRWGEAQRHHRVCAPAEPSFRSSSWYSCPYWPDPAVPEVQRLDGARYPYPTLLRPSLICEWWKKIQEHFALSGPSETMAHLRTD